MGKLRRESRWGRVFCVLLILAGNTATCFGQPGGSTAVDNSGVSENQSGGPSKAAVGRSFWDDAWSLPEIIVDETVEIVHKRDDLLLLLMAGGGSIALHTSGADKRIADDFDRSRALNGEADKLTDLFGGPGFHFAATGLWYVLSNNDPLSHARSWTMMKALSVTSATTLALKLIRNNHTPNGKSLAWPSGHTSSSFTVAAVLDELYGPKVGIPAYLGAGFVGYRMMDAGDHWASDVLFGAVLGYLVGHHIAGKDMEIELAGFELVPYTSFNEDKPVMGVGLAKAF